MSGCNLDKKQVTYWILSGIGKHTACLEEWMALHRCKISREKKNWTDDLVRETLKYMYMYIETLKFNTYAGKVKQDFLSISFSTTSNEGLFHDTQTDHGADSKDLSNG